MPTAVHSDLSWALTDLVEEFGRSKLQYAVIGGVAVSMRGRVRATEDVDVIIDCDCSRALEFFDSLSAKLFEPMVSDTAAIIHASRILPLRHVPTQVGLDLAVGESGLEKQIVSRATEIEIGAEVFRVATAEDLILMKLLAARGRDLDDVQALIRVKLKSLDWNYCLDTARQLDEALALDIAATLEKIRASLVS